MGENSAKMGRYIQKELISMIKKYLYVPPKTTIIRLTDGAPSERGHHSKPAKNHPWRQYKNKI